MRMFHTARRSVLRALAAGTALALALVHPLGAVAQETPREGGMLRISVDQAPAKLNPLQHRVNPEYLLGELLYSGLTRLSRDMTPEADLATSWESSEDLSEWTFELRPGVTFHDGSALDAEDVVATFEAILDPETGSPGLNNVGPIASVEAVDADTVRFTLEGPYADLPTALAYTNAKIVPSEIAGGDLAQLDREAVGTGPFQLVSYEPERQVVVERNPNYFLEGKPYLDRVEVVVYPDATAEGSALIAGDTDLMMSVDPSEFERVSSAEGVQGLRTPSGQFLDVVLGTDQEPFDDVRVRRALALSVDRGALVDFVAEGYGTLGNDTPVNEAYRFFTAQPQRAMDVEEARRLLAEAGHPDGLDLTLVASDTPSTRAQLGVAMREMARPAGFNIEVQTMPHATYLDQVWKQGPFYVGLYNMQATPDAILSLLFTSDAPWNETKWNNEEFDRLVEEARRTADEAERAELYARAQALMHEEVPALIPVFFDLLAATRDYVEGYELHPRGAVFRIDDVWLGEGAPERG